jgi:hypothetical protein
MATAIKITGTSSQELLDTLNEHPDVDVVTITGACEISGMYALGHQGTKALWQSGL